MNRTIPKCPNGFVVLDGEGLAHNGGCVIDGTVYTPSDSYIVVQKSHADRLIHTFGHKLLEKKSKKAE